MPITINLTRGRTATFPDGTSEESITRILDEDYPLEGVDIDEMVMGDPDFEPTFEQYQLFQQHAYDKDESMFAGMGEGLEHIAGVGWEAAKELPGMGWDELKYQAMKKLVPGGGSFMPPVSPRTASTLAESGMQGTRELLGMGAQSADPDSIFFRWKSLMEGRGKATDKGRYEQFKDAREFQRRTLQMEDGRTISLSDIAQLIQKNPEAPEGVLGGLHFDFDDPHTQKRMKELGWEKGMLPEELVNTDFVRGAKYVTDPSMLIPGFGALGKGATLGTKAAGATLRGTGKVMRGAGGGVYRAGTAIGETVAEGVTKATGVSPGVVRGGAAAVGVTTPGGQIAAGVLVGARATEAVGTVLARAGEVMAGGPTRRGVFKQVAHDLEKGTLEYALARGIGMADKPMAIVGQAAEAGIHGGLIGGGLGFLHAGPEGFGPGFGAGFGMGGTIGGVVGVGQLARGKNAMTAKTANDVLNQIKTMEPEQAAMFNEIVAREGVDVAANILDWAAFMEGRLGDGAVKYFWNPHEARGSAPLPSMTAGKPTIEINLAKMDSDYTVGHEIVHGLDHIEDLQPIMHQIRQEIAGMWIDGNMVEQGGMTLTALETRYIEYMNLLAKGEGEKRAKRIIGGAKKKGAKLSKEEVSRIRAEEHRNALEKFTADHGTAEKRALYVADEIMAEQMARLIKGAGPGAGLYGFNSITRRVLDHSLLKYKGTVLGGMIGRLTEWGIDPYDSMLFKNLEQAPPELRAMLRNLIRARNNLSKQIEVSDARPDIITKRELKHRLPELKRQGLVKQNEKGDWVFKDDKEVEAAEVASEEALVSILSREDPDGKSAERRVNEDTGKAEYIMTGSRFSPAQLAAIAGHPDILPTVKQSLGRWSKAIDEGGILNVTYYAATKRIKNRFTGRYRSKYGSGIKKSNRNLLPFTDEMSKVGGNLFGKGIDWTLLTNDIIALAVKKKLSPWANNPRAFINDFTEYLTNLSAGAKQRSYEKFGDAKAEFMREILLKQHRGGSKYVKSFRFDRMDGIISTGEYNVVHDPALRGKIPFVGQEHPKVSSAGKPIRMSEQAWAGSQARHMPDTGEAVQHTPRDAINGKAEAGTVLPAMTVITPELAARFMPDVNDPGYASIKGKMAFPMLADRMKVGEYVGRSGKVHELRGGPDHVDIADNLGVVAWAVEGGPIASQLQKAINQTDGVGLVVLQSEQAVSGNRTFGDIMIDELRYDASHRKKTAIDNRIKAVVKILKAQKNKEGNLKYPMLQDVSIKNLDDLAAVHPRMSFDLRGDMFRKVASIDYQRKTGGIFWRDVMRDVSAYQSKDGYRTGDIVKAIQFEKGDSIVDPKDIGTPVHPSYALAVKGRSLGNIKGRLSAYQVFRDAFNTMGKEKPGRGVSSKGKVGKNAYRSMQMRSLTDPIFRQKVGSKSLDVKSYDKPLEFKADSGPKRAELAKRSEINKELGARHMPDVGRGEKSGSIPDKNGWLLPDGTFISAKHQIHDWAMREWVEQNSDHPFASKVFKKGGRTWIRRNEGNGRAAASALAAGAVRVVQHGGPELFYEGVANSTQKNRLLDTAVESEIPLVKASGSRFRGGAETEYSPGGRYMPDVGGQDALGMFSAAERATVNLKQETGSAAQMLAMIKKSGVKDAELSALGLDKFLEGNRKVTKDEIIDHLVENQITVEETVLGGKRELNQAEEMMQGGDEPIGAERAATKHASYVEPGAVEGSYRELLLRLPEGKAQSVWLLDPAGNRIREVASGDEARAFVRENPDYSFEFSENQRPYTGGHYGEYPNVLAHVRFNDQQSKYGKTLSIQEVQSDLHQEGRKKGYASEAKETVDPSRWTADHGRGAAVHPPGRWTVYNEQGGVVGSGLRADSATEAIRLTAEAMAAEPVKDRGTVPDFPFKTSWHELAMKRMIAYAVQNGYDAISWTTGETQFKRYGSSEIAWKRVRSDYPNNFTPVWRVKGTEQRAGALAGVNIEEAARAHGILKEGAMDISSKDQLRSLIEGSVMIRERGQWSPENFEKQVDKLTNRVWERMQNEDAGTSLPRKEGMGGFYDKMMVQIKTWKKLGLKVESDFLLTEKTRKMVFEVYDERGGTERTAPTVSRHDSLEGAAAATRGNPNLLHREAWAAGKGATPTHLVGFTPEMKAKVLDTGLSRFMPDAAAPNTLKNQLGWSLIKGQGSKWRVYKPNGVLAGIAATKASAERMFRTHYKRELRKGDQ